MPDWLSGAGITWIVAAWVVIVVGVGITVPILLVRLPSDYFRDNGPPPTRHLAWKIVRNLIGAVLLVAGVALVVLPGPGLLCVLVAVMLLDIPGKRRVERWIFGRKQVLSAANWLRRKAGRPPLRVGA